MADICYNIRFFELNGPQRPDKWSCRQSAIYQKVLPGQRHSAWAIIQAPISFRETLQDYCFSDNGHPLALHVRYIRSCTHSWREYLNYKDAELLLLVSEIFCLYLWLC
jgi:hypothetical protein